MARRKGKANRRIKDWHRRYVSGEHEEDTPARREKLSEEAVKLPTSRLSAAQDRPESSWEGLAQARGMVVGLFPGGVAVRIDAGELFCGIAKTFRAPEGSSALAVGDDVTVALTDEAHADQSQRDGDRADGMVLSRGPRETALSRPRPSSGKRRGEHDGETFEKVVAANMDVLLIVAAVRRPPLRHGLIDRFLIIAERGEMEPVLVINKSDLGRDGLDETVLTDFEDLGVQILFCSALTGEGMEALGAILTGKRSILAGASGVGKSTLVNGLIPGATAATREIRDKDNRGRHTTSATKVYRLPGGGLLVDTPGIRELGMHLEADELPWYFPEFEALSRECRFNDCTHTHEPGCAVRSAAESGSIPSRRYASYLRLLDTI
jgi:ribosome biogenesis GTPase / thiamine phosphate phosphatase